MRRCELQCTLVEFAKKGYEGSVDRVGSSCVEMAAVVLTRVCDVGMSVGSVRCGIHRAYL